MVGKKGVFGLKKCTVSGLKRQFDKWRLFSASTRGGGGPGVCTGNLGGGGGGAEAPFTAKTSPFFGENALFVGVEYSFHVKLRNGLRELTAFAEH